MENILTVHLSSMNDQDYQGKSDFTEWSDSGDEQLFESEDSDDDEDDDDNNDGNDDINNRSNDGCGKEMTTLYHDAELSEDFVYKDEGAIYAEGHAIRLLRLQGGEGPLQAFLFKAFLHTTGNDSNGMPYKALSYTWGSSEKTQKIALNGKRFMVTENLYSALKYLRSPQKDQIFWIDAICIDQNHISERNHQVSHMSSIYHSADSVTFWLGEPTYETDRLISSLTQLQACVSDVPDLTLEMNHISQLRTLWNDEGLYEDALVIFRGLVSLLARPWFTRSWILQEVCFARSSVVACGKMEIAAHVFALAPALCKVDPEAHCQAVLQLMPGATRSTRTYLSGRETRNLYSLLLRFHGSKAADPRDQIYALLSMATDADNDKFPTVDYGKKNR